MSKAKGGDIGEFWKIAQIMHTQLIGQKKSACRKKKKKCAFCKSAEISAKNIFAFFRSSAGYEPHFCHFWSFSSKIIIFCKILTTKSEIWIFFNTNYRFQETRNSEKVRKNNIFDTHAFIEKIIFLQKKSNKTCFLCLYTCMFWLFVTFSLNNWNFNQTMFRFCT